ncbi:NHL-repeat-containing protein [Cotonvirus japonicus]|uniref:NHL-repeat-containing protein n=1 Tax=Cotonvirus japonicus TaxID=2811091 RepID=A0ABM7NTG3_9VIRU|nr:NHL-repeat-containing protein [Cotonvirus japonicus]BCS83468.1 NHL-repeat-containing protein [Cotonvirus japonicus]
MASYRDMNIRRQIIENALPNPYFYPYVSLAPNLSSSTMDERIIVDPNIQYSLEGQDCFNAYPSLYLPNSRVNPYNNCYYGSIPAQEPSYYLDLQIKIITSNLDTSATNIDEKLINPRNLMICLDKIWVCIPGCVREYNFWGTPTGKNIGVFGTLGNIVSPSCIVFNDNLDFFPIVKGSVCEASTMLVATLDGTINAFNPRINPDNTILVVDNCACNSVYTGIAIYRNMVYVTDFFNQKIDVFDDKFNPILDVLFIDPCPDVIPDDFAPYNIVNIGDFLYVTYACQNPYENQYELDGTGLGYINVFTINGIFVKRFASRGTLNVPWGIIEAPTHFGYPAGSLFISNFGSGTINVFDINGCYISNIRDSSGIDLFVSGLRGIACLSFNSKTIYWTSDCDHRVSGLGTINIGKQ